MQIDLIQFSAVVAGKTHNPSLLNPDFLAINGIVPREWGWKVGETISTPPLGLVRYTNGVTITVEHHKLQVVDPGPDLDPVRSQVVGIAQGYVNTLPHIPYSAAGINFQSIAQLPEPEAYLKRRFLRSGTWDAAERPLTSVGLQLVYPLAGGHLFLSMDVGEADKMENEKSKHVSVVLVKGNFHRECHGYPAKDDVIRHLNQAAEDWKMYQAVMADVLVRGEPE
jgi:hypothetical protein